MKSLTRNGIILMMALALLGAVVGYSVYTLVSAQPFILCGSNDPEFEGCAPNNPGTGNDIVAIGPNPVDVDGDDGNDQMFNGAVQTEGTCAGFNDAPSADTPVTMTGGPGDDLLVDNDNGNTLVGGEGNDVLIANGGCDVLDGGDGDDFLSGGPGHDSFSEGEGSDIVIGGPGLDSYTADSAAGSNDIFIIYAGDVPSGETEEILCGEVSGDPAGQTNLIIFVGFGTTVIVDADNDPSNGFQVRDPITGGTYEFNATETKDDPNTPENEAACDQVIGL
jgi:hypothetical protein